MSPRSRRRCARRRSTSRAPTIRAPITGRIGRSVFTTGALVTAAQTNALATIQRHRSDLCRHPAVERRPAEAAPADPQRPGRRADGQCPRQADAGGRQRLWSRGYAALRRRDRRSDHRIAGDPRAVPQSQRAAAAGHVRPRARSSRARSRRRCWCRSARSAATKRATRRCWSSAPATRSSRARSRPAARSATTGSSPAGLSPATRSSSKAA